MQQIARVSEPEGKAADLLDAVKASLGATPNIFTTMANAPAVLEGFLGFSGALAKGVLSNEQREAIALALAGVNNCRYCAAAHTFIGSKSGVASDEELIEVLSHVALNIFTNYFNESFAVEVDFPSVDLPETTRI